MLVRRIRSVGTWTGARMGSPRRTRTGREKEARRPLPGRPLLFGIVGLAVLMGVAIWAALPGPRGQSDAAQHRGGARLAVDKDLIDFGSVRYGQFVEARFRLKNVGDQPLRLPASPPIEVVEGC
jgi:hypothetical protein